MCLLRVIFTFHGSYHYTCGWFCVRMYNPNRKPINIHEKEFHLTWFKLFGTEILRSSVGPTPLGLFAPNFPLHLLLFLGLVCWLTGCFHWGVLVNLNIKNYVSDFFPDCDFWYMINKQCLFQEYHVFKQPMNWKRKHRAIFKWALILIWDCIAQILILIPHYGPVK